MKDPQLKIPIHFPTAGEVVNKRIKKRLQENIDTCKKINIVYMKMIPIKDLLK